ncbi:MAG TPA: hypothetical protein DCM62_08320, partial [Bacteroidales bacterium]|nr:hypothetical protein [Bacteroidales bacterium]
MNGSSESVLRIDKWLWAVRLFKTRSLASEACRTAKVTIEGKPVKPSREVQVGMKIMLREGPLTRTVEVKAVPPNRVGAKLVADFLIDHTPMEEYEKLKIIKESPLARLRGEG